MAYNKLDGDSDAAEAHAKARGKKVSMAKKMHVKDEGYGNISHLAKTVKRGHAVFKGVSHWTKDEKDKGKSY
jgi:hypothetical protein